jgi:hypothetical protein
MTESRKQLPIAHGHFPRPTKRDDAMDRAFAGAVAMHP